MDSMSLRIGFTGYSSQAFDKQKAINLLRSALADAIHLSFGIDLAEVDWPSVWFVSGCTNLGIPALTYKEAQRLGAKTMGIACQKAADYECFPCDRVHLIGNNWGEESESFLAAIDILIRIGGGIQALDETRRAKNIGVLVVERDLQGISPKLRD